MTVDDLVAERIAAARARAEAARRRRAAQRSARQAGLAHRHAAKLRRQAQQRGVATPTPRPCICGRDPDPGVCPIDHGRHPAGGHCTCIHITEGNPA